MNHHEHDKLPHVIEGKRQAELLQKRLDAEFQKRFETTGVDPNTSSRRRSVPPATDTETPK